MHKVFYSWQSDLDPKANRHLIGNALKAAAKLLHREGVEIDTRIDQDARDCPGAPDIAAELFRKITESRVFVADVSIVNPATPPAVSSAADSEPPVQATGPLGNLPRLTPNPNVMIELGFAAHALPWDRCVCVVNEAYGRVEDLPFDIRPRSMVRYKLAASAKTDERRQAEGMLRDWLKNALEVCIARTEREQAEQQQRAQELAQQQQAIAHQQEIRRQNAILQQLRHLYCLSHDGLSPGIIAGTAPLPREWVEQQLAGREEKWRRDVYY